MLMFIDGLPLSNIIYTVVYNIWESNKLYQYMAQKLQEKDRMTFRIGTFIFRTKLDALSLQ